MYADKNNTRSYVKYGTEEFQEYQNPIKVTWMSPFGGMDDFNYNQDKVKYDHFCYVLKKKKCIREVRWPANKRKLGVEEYLQHSPP